MRFLLFAVAKISEKKVDRNCTTLLELATRMPGVGTIATELPETQNNA
jgi:hypothetical protein